MTKSDPDRPADRTAFHRLFVEHHRRIFEYILAMLPRLADAEEVFQDVSVIVLDKQDQFTLGSDFLGWACQIARYEVFNYRRRLQAKRLCHLSEPIMETLAARHLRRRDLLEAHRAMLAACVGKLRPRDRELIQRRYQRGVKVAGLAAELGRPLNTVHSALTRIRRTLRQCVQKAVAREKHT
jgi:RNA polymerase sigma-70 factor (ECF subfamily)